MQREVVIRQSHTPALSVYVLLIPKARMSSSTLVLEVLQHDTASTILGLVLVILLLSTVLGLALVIHRQSTSGIVMAQSMNGAKSNCNEHECPVTLILPKAS